MKSFDTFHLPEGLKQSLKRMQFLEPTPIQADAIPPALEGKDVLGTAQTGTGKTGAFGIPLMARLINTPRDTALVLTPTRELAMQVKKALEEMGAGHPAIKSALLIGGESMPKQMQALRQRPRLIVGTPGRINDHLGRGTLMLHQANFVVLDEMDRMLDMGFEVQLEAIFKFLPNTRQSLMFSATMPPRILKISQKYMNDPVRISIGSTVATAENLTQAVVRTSDKEKYIRLVEQIETRDGSIIIFVRTKHGAQKLADKLDKKGFSADAMHGDLSQNQRERVIRAFRDKKHRVMVATDIAARGLDIPHIEHVINFDLPQAPEDYIHRIGRTARNGAEGESICLVTPKDEEKWEAIEKMLEGKPEKEGSSSPNRKKSSSRSRRPGGGSGGRPGGKSFGGKKSFGGEKRGDGEKRHGGEKRQSGEKSTGGANKPQRRRQRRPAQSGQRSQNKSN